MTADEFDFAADFIRSGTGFILTRDKSYLIETRLGPVVRRHRLGSVGELVAAVRAGRNDLGAEMLDAMMTKDTGFFRDWKPFVHLRDTTLRDLVRTRSSSKAVRILCAGVSTGQEAYSAALTVLKCGGLRDGWRIDIVGIDLSTTALAIAERGAYTQFEVQRGLPMRTLAHHFIKVDENWVLEDAVRAMVTFKPWNLLDTLMPLGRFDVIFCRNVLAYFDLRSKAATLRKLADIIAPDGRLYLGTAETTAGITEDYRTVDAALSVYAPNRSETQSGAKALV